jgi:hypothetical protein
LCKYLGKQYRWRKKWRKEGRKCFFKLFSLPSSSCFAFLLASWIASNGLWRIVLQVNLSTYLVVIFWFCREYLNRWSLYQFIFFCSYLTMKEDNISPEGLARRYNILPFQTFVHLFSSWLLHDSEDEGHSRVC